MLKFTKKIKIIVFLFGGMINILYFYIVNEKQIKSFANVKTFLT